MKYRCLILDHDDTVVKSTPTVHYPSFVEIMRRFRPGLPIPTLREFMEFCSEPGYFAYCRDTLHFTPEENVLQDEMWHSYVAGHAPSVYEGFPELLRDYRAAGGEICVVTHSESAIVLRDYRRNNLPTPALVFGAELGEARRKPNPWPVEEIERRLGFSPAEMVMVDDLMTGIAMAERCGVFGVGAGWSHISPRIRERVKGCCGAYCETVEQLREIVL